MALVLAQLEQNCSIFCRQNVKIILKSCFFSKILSNFKRFFTRNSKISFLISGLSEAIMSLSFARDQGFDIPQMYVMVMESMVKNGMIERACMLLDDLFKRCSVESVEEK